MRIVPGLRQIAAPLTSQLRFEIGRQPSTVAGGPSTVEVNGGTQVGVGAGGEVEVDGVEVGKFEIASKSAFFDFRSKVLMHLES